MVVEHTVQNPDVNTSVADDSHQQLKIIFIFSRIMQIIIYFLISIYVLVSREQINLVQQCFTSSPVRFSDPLWKFHSRSRSLTTSPPSLCKVGTCSQWTNRISLFWNALHIFLCGRLAPYNAEDSHQTQMLGNKNFAGLSQSRYVRCIVRIK